MPPFVLVSRSIDCSRATSGQTYANGWLERLIRVGWTKPVFVGSGSLIFIGICRHSTTYPADCLSESRGGVYFLWRHSRAALFADFKMASMVRISLPFSKFLNIFLFFFHFSFPFAWVLRGLWMRSKNKQVYLLSWIKRMLKMIRATKKNGDELVLK